MVESSKPLLVGDTWDGIAGKLKDPHSVLAPWWQHFISLSRADPVWYSPYTVLTALVTGEAADRERARQAFLRFADLQAEGEISVDAQYHTHVVTAPLGRWALFYDWIADLGWFSPEEDQHVREYFLHFGNIFALQHVQSRRLDFDNQVLANAFGAMAVGYVLGYKRGDSALARRMYHSGLTAVQMLLARIPTGGYSGEGSTYQEHVVEPLTLLSALLVEETTGVPILTGETPMALAVQNMLSLSYESLGPSGLLPAWDDHGFQAATHKMVLTYLARFTGESRPLAAIRDLHLWYRQTSPAWEMDDRLWTLLWWPSALDDAEASFKVRPWMREEIGGALAVQSRQLRLFQCWDECYGVPCSGRAQVDPNAITFEAFGSPILVDGAGQLDPSLSPVPTAPVLAYIGARTRESLDEYFFSAFGAQCRDEEALTRRAMGGSVSCTNALILDGESWYVPLSPKQGHGEALHAHGELQVLRSDAAAIYRDRYDVSAVTRTSMLVKEQYLLVSDRVQALTPHQVTWQAFLRQQVTQDGSRIIVNTPELVHCDLLPLQSGTWAIESVSGYPKGLDEGKSIRAQFSVPAAADVRLDMALLPAPGYQVVEDITDGWERTVADEVSIVSLTSAYLTDPMVAPETPRTYRRQVTIAQASSRRLYFNLGIASRGLRVLVNGVDIVPTMTQARGIWLESSTYLPFFYDLSAALQEGNNEITLIAPYFHGETVCGPARLCEPIAVAPVDVRRTGEDTFSVTMGTEHDDLIMERTQGCAPWLDGETDARYAVRSTAGTVTACAVTRLRLPSLSFRSSYPVDFSWSQDGASMSALPLGASVMVQWDSSVVQIETHGALQITYHGQRPYPLILDIEPDQHVLVNGLCVHAADGLPHRAYSVLLSPVTTAPSVPTSAEEVYRLAEIYGIRAGDVLIDALRSDDWTIQLAAADVIGRLGLIQAVPKLLALFSEAEAELPYPALRKCWRASKRLRLSTDEGPDPDLPLPIGVKRWRVKRAVVTALGKLGDPTAIAPLEQALLCCDDFFPVLSQLAVALGRLGAPSSVALLERCLTHAEANLRYHAQLSYALLRGDMTRQVFETQIGVV
ncbi:MAG: HEAT repeat domain-containing protein [Armatimonadota bacterium]